MRSLALILVTLVSGCASVGDPRARPLKPLEVATAPYDPTVISERIGSLFYENGCLKFREQGSDEMLLPVWPTGSSFNGTSLTFHEPGKSDQLILIAQQFVIKGHDIPPAVMGAGSLAPFNHQCQAPEYMVAHVQPSD